MPRDASTSYDREVLQRRQGDLRGSIAEIEAWLLGDAPDVDAMQGQISLTEGALEEARKEFREVADATVIDMRLWERAEDLLLSTRDLLDIMRAKKAEADNLILNRRRTLDLLRTDLRQTEEKLALWSQVVPLFPGKGA